MIKNIILNNIASKIIILMLFFFNTASASEAPDYIRDYRGGNHRIINANVTNTAGNDIVDNVLTSLANNNTLFVCYSGYKFVSNWEHDGGNYRTDPLNPQHTNILTEIDLHTKIEHKFETPREIDNKQTVNDIIRWKDNYCVAHASDIYVYHASYGWITSNKLTQQQHLHCNLSGDDVIKKIFVDQNSNILGVSAQGFIFKEALAISTHEAKISLQPIFNIFDSPKNKQKIHCFAYNQKENLLLCGCTGSIQIVNLKSTPPKLCTIKTAPNFSINTIDTNDTLLLFSDAKQNQHINWNYYNGHRQKDENIPCCMERTIPYDKWSDCESCKIAQEKWDNTSISLTINETGKYFIQEARRILKENHPKPKPCIHKICPADQTTLPDSCLNSNIILVTLERLGKCMQCNTEVDIKNLNPLKKTYRINNDISDCSDSKTFITDIALSDDFLFIGTINKRCRDRNIYKFPLNPLNNINEDLDLKDCDSSHKNNRFLHHYFDGDSVSSSADYRDYRKNCPLTINKSLEDREKIVLSRIIPSCSRWDQGGCPDGDHHFRYIKDIITFVKKDTPFDIRQNSLIIWLKRTCLRVARMKKTVLLLLISTLYALYKYNTLNSIKLL